MDNDHDDAWNDDGYGDDGWDDGDAPGDDGAGRAGIAGWWAHLSGGGRAGVIVTAVVAVLLVAALVFALGRGDDDEPPATTAPRTTTTVGITTTTEAPTGPVAPLTGLRMADAAAAGRPALAVKIDNLDTPGETAVPQAGLPLADVVVEEIVEGNITRLVAIFHSQDPGGRVGPVRSARTTDIHILPQLGRTLLGWSGGNAGVTAAVQEAPSIIDVGPSRAGAAYTRDRTRRAPHNLYVDAASLWGLAPEEVTPPRPIFEFRDEGSPEAAGVQASSGVDLTWGGGAASSPVSWTWDPALALYTREQRDHPHADESGTQLGAQNVVVLVTPYGQSPADARSPEALTVGSGEAYVFTAGTVVRGRWDRPSVEEPARLTDEAGAPILLTPGQTWIELPREGGVAVR